MSKKRRILSLALILVMLLTTFSGLVMAKPVAAEESGKITAQTDENGQTVYLRDQTKEELNQEVTIMVQISETTPYLQTSDLELASSQQDGQLALLAQAENRIESWVQESIEINSRFTLLFNGFSFDGPQWMIDAINQLEGITAFEAPVFEVIQPETDLEDTLSPNMGTSTGMVGATTAWDLGYTGKGMTIAIIDTGIRTTHEAFSAIPEGGKIDVAYLNQVYETYGDKMHAGTAADIENIYHSGKIPFAWDYFDHDAEPNHTASDHGSHVAGIAAGNNGVDFKGVAPDAQLVVMQVFQDNGGASFETLMEAMEDCVYLGVDALNMSLGSTAGYSDPKYTSEYMQTVYDALEAAGIAVAVAAGNETHNSMYTNFGDYFSRQWFYLAGNMDTGVIGSPASYVGSFAVGSVNNSALSSTTAMTAGSFGFKPTNIYGQPEFATLEPGDYDVVYVGESTAESIAAAGGVEGKVALVIKSDTVDPYTQCLASQEAGAIGCIIFNNVSGFFYPSMSAALTIPFGALSGTNGQRILETFADGVHGTISITVDYAWNYVYMAESSSWGTTADLRLTPDIAAPGQGISSAIGFGEDNSYASWGGTSMAAPHVAGGLVLIKQRLREEYPNATAQELNQLAYAYLMSTAHQVNGQVRQQGAGLMDLRNALETDAYLSVPGSSRPKVELDDNEEGKFTFSVVIHNDGTTDQTYKMVPSILTENVQDLEYSGSVMVDQDWARETGYNIANPETVTVKVTKGDVKDVTSLCDVTTPGTVTVPAGQTLTVEVSIACKEELMTWFRENCPSGMYLEGYIKFQNTAVTGIDLSVPFLGFVGDWDYAPMFDEGYWWNLPYGVNNMAQMWATKGTYVGYGVLDQGLGLNPYADMTGKSYLADRNAISPNGDDYLDAVNYVEFSLLRNTRQLKIYIEDEEGNVVREILDATGTYRKEYFTGGLNAGTTYSPINFEDYVAAEMEENETAYLVMEAWLDHDEYTLEGNKNGYQRFPITKDLTAPAVRVVDGGIEIVDANYTAWYGIYADEAMTELLFETGVFAEQRAVAEFYETDATTIYVKTADFAHNEAKYKVENGMVIQLEADPLPGREIVARQHINYATGLYDYSFNKFNSETAVAVERFSISDQKIGEPRYDVEGYDIMSAAVAVDGTIYASGLDELFILDPETFEATKVANFESANGGRMAVRSIMTHPETYEIYAFGWNGSVFNNILGKLDVETGVVTPLFTFADFDTSYMAFFYVYGACFVDESTVAVAAQNDVLYLYDLHTGAGKKIIDFKTKNPKYGGANTGISGYGGNLIYDETENTVYYTTHWKWFRDDRYNQQGMVKIDLDTETVTLQTIGNGYNSMYALYFSDSVKPADFWACMELIKAIGEVELDDGDRIDAAREAYDSLPEDRKARVENYEDLLKAEHQYVILKAEHASFQAAMYYAQMVLADLEDYDTSKFCPEQMEAFEAAAETFEEALAVAMSAEDVNAALEELFAVLDNLDALHRHHEELVNVREASCTLAGYTGDIICAYCGEVLEEGEVIPMLDHTPVLTGYQEATCTEDGYTGDYTCSVCGIVVEEGEAIPASCGTAAFEDLDTDAWYHEYTDFVIENGLMVGISDTLFVPDAPMTRAQLVTVLYRMAGEPTVEGLENPFTDLTEDWYKNAVIWAAENDIVYGITETLFVPNAAITREQAATILYRAYGDTVEGDLDQYTDGKTVSAYAVEAMIWATETGLFQGFGDNTLRPLETLTRVQMAKLLTVLDMEF